MLGLGSSRFRSSSVRRVVRSARQRDADGEAALALKVKERNEKKRKVAAGLVVYMIWSGPLHGLDVTSPRCWRECGARRDAAPLPAWGSGPSLRSSGDATLFFYADVRYGEDVAVAPDNPSLSPPITTYYLGYYYLYHYIHIIYILYI